MTALHLAQPRQPKKSRAARFLRLSLPTAAICCLGHAASAHEAWLLTPQEVAELSRMPMPDLFTNTWLLALAALIGSAAATCALIAEARFQPLEARVFRPLERFAPVIGPLAIRLGLAVMLCLASIGGLPRHGTAMWTQPTLFVPDMQLSLAAGWGWLAPIEAVLSLMLLTGLMTRISGLLVIGLSACGLLAFGLPFLSYAAHFTAPALILVLCGSGCLSLDRALGSEDWAMPAERIARFLWPMSLLLVGGGFAYLAVTVKLTQPTLLMAILDHGEVPLMGIPLPVIALIMAGVELIAGCLLAAGRLVRPIAVFLIGAFTFFAVAIGETPLFHINLYGTCVMFLLAGALSPRIRGTQDAPAPATA